eukprot:XP_001700118.1 DNA polymerase eta/iota [Chlamydomonas reinhardtii]
MAHSFALALPGPRKFPPFDGLPGCNLQDLDCFYCQVEQKRLGIPREQPVAVQQWDGLIAINYAARAAGVTRHMRVREAKKLCPQLRLVHVETISAGDGESGSPVKASGQIMALLGSMLRPSAAATAATAAGGGAATATGPVSGGGCLLEKASVDEAFLDVSPLVACSPCGGGLIAQRLRRAVYEQLGFTCSAGVSVNKLLAKVGSARNKPDKQTLVLPRGVQDMLTDLPLGKLRGLGGKLGAALEGQLGAATAGQAAALPLEALQRVLGERSGLWVWQVVRGQCSEPVTPKDKPKSLLSCKSFEPTSAPAELQRWLLILAEELGPSAAAIAKAALDLLRRQPDAVPCSRLAIAATEFDDPPAAGAAAITRFFQQPGQHAQQTQQAQEQLAQKREPERHPKGSGQTKGQPPARDLRTLFAAPPSLPPPALVAAHAPTAAVARTATVVLAAAAAPSVEDAEKLQDLGCDSGEERDGRSGMGWSPAPPDLDPGGLVAPSDTGGRQEEALDSDSDPVGDGVAAPPPQGPVLVAGALDQGFGNVDLEEQRRILHEIDLRILQQLHAAGVLTLRSCIFATKPRANPIGGVTAGSERGLDQGRVWTWPRSWIIGPLAQEFSGLLDSKLGLLDSKLESSRSDVSGQLTKFGGELTKFGGELSSVRKNVARLVTQQGHLLEFAAKDVLQGQFAGADVGFWHLLLQSVKKVLELAGGQAPTSSVAAAAKGLQEMGAERFVQAMATAAATSVAAAVGSSHGQQCTSSIAVQAPQMRLHEAYLLKVVQLLHQSGQGCMLFADELELYLRAEGSAAGARVNLLLGRTVPFLTAVATGVAVPELELDRCSSLSLRSWAPSLSAWRSQQTPSAESPPARGDHAPSARC